MKTIKSIIFVAIILSSYVLSVKRTEKKKKTLTKRADYDGDGSWSEGYNTPGFLIETGKNSFNNDQRKGKGKFYAGRLELPGSADEKIGWTFDMSKMAPTENLAKIMIRSGTSNVYYIPFRWLATDFAFTNPRGYKYLEGWVTNDEKELFHVRLLLPYAFTTYYISDDEGNRIARILNNKRVEHRGLVSAKKSGANTAANSFISNKPLYTSAIGDIKLLEAEQEKQRKLTVTLAEDQKTKESAYLKTSSEIDVLELKLLSLKVGAKTLRDLISSISNQIDTINLNIQISEGSSKEIQAKTFKSNLDAAEVALKANIGELKAEVRTKSAELDKAQDAILTKLSKTEFDVSLNLISP